MSIEIVKYQPSHLRALMLQEAQAFMQPLLADPGYADMLYTAGPAYTAIDGDQVLASAGVMVIWEGRGIAWALLSQSVGPRAFIRVHRAVCRFFDLCALRRIETTVSPGFVQGHRWMASLGFVRETPGVMKAWTPDGQDMVLYARIQ